MNIVLLGLPGAGKGTQAKYLSKEFDFFHLSTGDLFRKAIKEENTLGQKAKKYIAAGNLVPDEITIALLEKQIEAVDKRGIFFDGFPRTENQALALADMLEVRDKQVDLCIYIEVEVAELVKRISGRRICRDCGAIYHCEYTPPNRENVCDKCGGTLYQRTDDNEIVVKNRIKKNQLQMRCLLAYYEKKGVLRTVTGTGKLPEDVMEETRPIVKEYLS